MRFLMCSCREALRMVMVDSKLADEIGHERIFADFYDAVRMASGQELERFGHPDEDVGSVGTVGTVGTVGVESVDACVDHIEPSHQPRERLGHKVEVIQRGPPLSDG